MFLKSFRPVISVFERHWISEARQWHVINGNRTLCSLPNDPQVNIKHNKATLKKLFRCTDEQVTEIYKNLVKPQSNLNEITANVKWLRRRNVPLSSILDNCSLLLKPLDQIEKSFLLLKEMKWKQLEDFVPLVTLSSKEIIKLQGVELNRIRNRVYKLAAELQFEPHIVSKYCAKNSVVFMCEYEMLCRKIQILLNYNVSRESIMKDLQGLNSSEQVLKERLEFLNANGIERILPWMMRCTIDKIQRTIDLRDALTPEQNRVVDYLATNLKLQGSTARKLMKRLKFMRRLNLNELSPVVEFLLEIFEPEQIANNIYLINGKLPELERRIQQARSLGIDNPNPKYLSKSKSVFESYLRSVAETAKPQEIKTTL